MDDDWLRFKDIKKIKPHRLYLGENFLMVGMALFGSPPKTTFSMSPMDQLWFIEMIKIGFDPDELGEISTDAKFLFLRKGIDTECSETPLFIIRHYPSNADDGY